MVEVRHMLMTTLFDLQTMKVKEPHRLQFRGIDLVPQCTDPALQDKELVGASVNCPSLKKYHRTGDVTV